MKENQHQQKTTQRGDNPVIPAPSRKRMSITAKCGVRTKTITFPIPPEFEAWMCVVRDGTQIEVEGGNAIRIHLEIFNYKEKF